MSPRSRTGYARTAQNACRRPADVLGYESRPPILAVGPRRRARLLAAFASHFLPQNPLPCFAPPCSGLIRPQAIARPPFESNVERRTND